MSALPLALAVGDPCGVGPEVALQAALERRAELEIVLFGDAEQIVRVARRKGEQAALCVLDQVVAPPRGRLGVVDTGTVPERVISRHAPHAEAGLAQIRSLDAAAHAVQAGAARALVTGPTCKEAVVLAGQSFVGQTEHLARFAGLADDAVTMMFLGPRLRVALVTTHLAIAATPTAITAPRVERTVRHLCAALQRLSGNPRKVAVTGLNPHAGEGGVFGMEEIDVVAPVLRRLRVDPTLLAFEFLGPSPAESVFRAAARGELGGVVAMIHDQATIASKLLDWGSAVNVTWGLPFVRTSVDHGVAFDAAQAGTADAEGMRAALRLADELSRADG